MNKNTDEKTVVISREIYNRILPELESNDPDLAATLVRHVSRFNPHIRRELDKKQRSAERVYKEVAGKVSAFVEEHRGKEVWIRDKCLPRVMCDFQSAMTLVGDETRAREIVARCKQLITFKVKVITKSPGGLGVLVEFPRATKEYKPARVNVYLEHLSLEQPEGEVEATWDEIKSQEQIWRSLDLLTPQARAKSMRECLLDHLAGDSTIEFNTRIVRV